MQKSKKFRAASTFREREIALIWYEGNHDVWVARDDECRPAPVASDGAHGYSDIVGARRADRARHSCASSDCFPPSCTRALVTMCVVRYSGAQRGVEVVMPNII